MVILRKLRCSGVLVVKSAARLGAQCLRSDVTLAWAEPAALKQEEREQDDALPRPIRPRDSRRLLCAGLAPLLREARVVACPRRKHALPPL